MARLAVKTRRRPTSGVDQCLVGTPEDPIRRHSVKPVERHPLRSVEWRSVQKHERPLSSCCSATSSSEEPL